MTRHLVHGDHPYTDPGDGRSQCAVCGKWVYLVTHSCKGIRVAPDAARTARPGDSERGRGPALGLVANSSRPGAPRSAIPTIDPNNPAGKTTRGD